MRQPNLGKFEWIEAEKNKAKENKAIAKKGGNVAKVARKELEDELGESIVSTTNRLDYEYPNDDLITTGEI